MNEKSHKVSSLKRLVMPGEPFFRFSFNSNWQIPDNENSQFHLSTLRERGYNVDSIFANLRASEAAPNRGQFTPSRVNSSLRNSKALETVEEPVVASETGTTKKANKKPLAFYLAFLGLNIVVFIVSLDATALSVALPVRSPSCPSLVAGLPIDRVQEGAFN